MIKRATRNLLERLVKGEVLFDELMKNHTSFHIGGPAEALVMPRDDADLKKLVVSCRKYSIPIVVIGNGTKLLVSDKGIDGVVAKLSGCLDDVIVSGRLVKSGSGRTLTSLSKSMIDYGLSGLEFAVGIPGTVGGATVMNAGAHGSMLSDFVTKVTKMDFDGMVKKVQKGDIFFGYRQSRFQSEPCIILTVEMTLAKNDLRMIRKKMDDYRNWRKEVQPQDFPNAGSIFKNPEGSSAGKLIDLAGLKGIKIGNAKISEKHANFIMNTGNATAQDVIGLMKKTQTEVLRQSGVLLEPEIRILGRFN